MMIDTSFTHGDYRGFSALAHVRPSTHQTHQSQHLKPRPHWASRGGSWGASCTASRGGVHTKHERPLNGEIRGPGRKN